MFHFLNNAGEHSRDDKGTGYGFFDTEAQPLRGIEIRQLHDLAAGVDVAHDSRDTGDVIGRYGDQCSFFFHGTHEFHRPEDVRNEMFMAQQGRFRCAGGTAGEELHSNRGRVFIPGDLRGFAGQGIC